MQRRLRRATVSQFFSIKRLLFYTLRLLYLALLGGTLWLGGLILFSRYIPVMPPSDVPFTDGLVIFTGGKTRLHVALDLFDQQKANYLLISGVNPKSSLQNQISGLKEVSKITVGYKGQDTRGNAEETALWAEANQIKSLRLITSNYHMPRSLLELGRVLPELKIIPYPVVGESFKNPKWWLNEDTLSHVIQEYHKFLFSLIRQPFQDLDEMIWKKETNT